MATTTPAVMLRRLHVAAGDDALDFPRDGGEALALPQSLRLLVDARAQTVSASAVDLDGNARTASRELTTLPAGTTVRVELDLSTPLQTPGELASILKSDPAVQQCMVKKTLGYAVGRSLGGDDEATVAALDKSFASSGRRFKALVRDVALSPLVVNGCRLK